MTRYTKTMLGKIAEWTGLVWLFGGGLPISVIFLAVLGWRWALVTFCIWILSIIGAIAYKYLRGEL